MTKKVINFRNTEKKLHGFKNNEITKKYFFYSTSFNFFSRELIFTGYQKEKKKYFFSLEPLHFIFI